MTTVGAVVLGDDRLQVSLLSDAEALDWQVQRAVSASADLAITKIRANASGRPGPNAPTGDYRRSWNRQTRNRKNSYTVSVGTNRPQARRLEFGFIGADSLGRVYHQPAYPHVEPAITPVFDYFTMRMERIRADLASGSLRIGPATG